MGAFLNDKPVGRLIWSSRGTGTIEKVHVDNEYRRQGIATALLAESRKYAKNQKLAAPTHSQRRSPAGDAWAQSLKEELPERKSDSELFQ